MKQVTLLIGALSILAALPGHAQTHPLEGSLELTFTATDISPSKRMPIGGGKEFLMVTRAMTLSNDTGGTFLNNVGGRCQFSNVFDTAAKTVEQHGYCTYEDADGHQLYEKCDFLPGSPTNCAFTGGTGKYEGLQGSMTVSFQIVKPYFDGIGQIVGHKRGTYRYPNQR